MSGLGKKPRAVSGWSRTETDRAEAGEILQEVFIVAIVDIRVVAIVAVKSLWSL